MNDDEARAILREHGEEPPARGRLGPQWRVRAEELRGPAMDGQPAADAYDGGTGPDDFGPDVTEAAEPPTELAEVKPRRVRMPRARATLTSRLKDARKPKARKKHPRVSVAQFVETFWAGMGGIVARVDPPVGRTLVMQADAAGDILEDAVKGTAADRALQPIVRNYERGRKISALVLPPMIVAAIEHAQTLPDRQREAREALLRPMLVSSLMLWDEVAAEKALERLERREAQAPRVEQAHKLAALIFASPEDVPQPETAAA